MESLWNEARIHQETHCFTNQAIVEGEIPYPEGRENARLLDFCGNVHIQECLCEADCVSLSGMVIVDLLCEGHDGELFSFSSRAAFRHSMQADGVLPDMTPEVTAVLQDLDMQGGSKLHLRALVNLSCRVVTDAPVRLLTGLRDTGDMQLETMKLRHVRRRCIVAETLRVRGEAAVPGVQTVIQSSATAAIRDVQYNGENIEINGLLRLKALCRSGDGHLFQAEQHIPFSETLAGDCPNVALMGEIEVESISARSVGEEFGILAAEARLRCRIFVREEREFELPLDAYSPSAPFRCSNETLHVRNFMGDLHAREAILENITIPEGMPDASRVISASVRPMLTDSTVQENTLHAEGALFLRILYTTEENKLCAFGTELPFASTQPVPAGADDTVVSLQADCSAAGTMHSVELSCNLYVAAALYAHCSAQLVANVEACDPHPVQKGLVVYFATEGESLFAVAKRYNTTREKLLALDPSLPPRLKEGQQIMMLL